MIHKTSILMVLLTVVSGSVFAQKPTVDTIISTGNYHKTKWGYAEEFLELYQKNHCPLLKRAQEKGDLMSIKIEKPPQHASEETRWDVALDNQFKNS